MTPPGAAQLAGTIEYQVGEGKFIATTRSEAQCDRRGHPAHCQGGSPS
ncbi:MAG: hypothetical protein KDA44_10835 [Planctomycetales bacterium]|nr:hypothetical protein [Planctomycetales bacterium]